jgi:hypothetical protein
VGKRMNIKESILKEEEEFPKLFSAYKITDFGIMFFMENNKDLHDGNHAIIYPDKIFDLGNVLDEITEFYLNKKIVPAIFHPFKEKYFEDNRAIFESHGYRLNIFDDFRFMILNEKNNLNTPRRLKIKRIIDWDERIANDIIIPCNEIWEIEPTQIALKNKDNYLFVGYLNDTAIVYTTLHKSVYGCTRFDYILTSINYRKNGYARELLNYVVEFCKINHLANCFQWAGPSEKITYEAGFREIFRVPSGYATYDRK